MIHRLSLSLTAGALSILPATGQGLGSPPVPPGNPITPEKAALGAALFWDEQLSATRTLACGTCHQPAAGGSDARIGVHMGPDRLFATGDEVLGSPSALRTGTGGFLVDEVHWGFGRTIQVTPRQSPSALMAAYAPRLRWDGLAAGEFRDPLTDVVVLPDGAALETQALRPLSAPTEMGHEDGDWTGVMGRIAASEPLVLATDVPAALDSWIAGRDYPALFEEVFGDPEITPVRLALALATYQRTLVPDATPIDDYWNGDTGALTAAELAGLQVFESAKASCAACHPAPLLTNHAFEYTGHRPPGDDRGHYYVTGNPDDKGRMRVPSLRNVELRAPYSHTGGLATLEDVIDFYDRGGDFDAPQKSPLIRPLGLTPQEKQDLLAFLRRPLTDVRLRDELPPFERPMLFTETQRVPRVFGTGLPGSGGFTPRMLAYEPPRIGSPRFMLGIDEGLGAAPAFLALGLRVGSGPLPTFRVTPGFTLHPLAALQGAGPGGGFGSIVLSIPDDPALVGETVFGQWVVRDAGGWFGMATSEVVELAWF